MTKVGFNLAKNISSPDKDAFIYDYLGEGCDGSMFLSPVDEQDIIRTVQQFKNKVSTDINMNMVKTIIIEIVKPLNHLCNVSFQTVVFRNQMPKLFQYLWLGISVYSQIIYLFTTAI